MPAIQIQGLSKTYKGNKTPTITNLSLQINQGEIFGILGPNGAGKTTLINILCGLQPFDKGQVTVLNNIIPQQLRNLKPQIGIVPQDIALYPTLTACENLKIIGGLFKMKPSDIRTQANQLLQSFGLEQHKNKRINTYSGGMKRRLNLIAALIHQPRLIILDEPTVGIDVQSKLLILNHLKQLNQQGTTIIYTSHYMQEAENLCTQITIINQGQTIATAPPQQLIRQHNAPTLEALYLKLTGKTIQE